MSLVTQGSAKRTPSSAQPQEGFLLSPSAHTPLFSTVQELIRFLKVQVTHPPSSPPPLVGGGERKRMILIKVQVTSFQGLNLHGKMTGEGWRRDWGVLGGEREFREGEG